MKTKLNITLSAILVAALMSCSAGHYASAQYDANDNGNGYYDQNNNGQNDQYNSDNYNNDNYNNSNDYNDNEDENYGTTNVSMDVFVGALSPYGRWVTSPSYGSVWICNQPNFVPYNTGGHWVYSEVGWTW